MALNMHSKAWRFFWLVAVSCLPWERAYSENAQQPRGESLPQATQVEIDQWIEQLDDNQFALREQAQARLQNAGLAAIDEIARAADGGSLESSTRALNILLTWSEDLKHPELRISALKKIIALEDRPRQSMLAGEMLANAKEEAALAKILELGGRCSIDTQARVHQIQLPGGPVRPLQVTIDTHWKGGIEGLQPLEDLRRVVTLSFHSAPLADELAPGLPEMPQLRRLELYGIDHLSPGSVELIKAKLPPGVVLDVRGPAKLGIQGNTDPGARVMKVIAGTAAEKAGLKPGDLITHFDGEPVRDFKQLTNLIKECKAKQSVMLTVQRQIGRGQKTKEYKIPVLFDRWGVAKVDMGQPTLELGQDFRRVLTPQQIGFDRR